MALEIQKNTLVPGNLILPPPAGSAPIWKLSIELFLTIAEYLDAASCLTFSQTCRTLLELSKARSVFWRSAQFAHGHLPRIADMASFTGAELRTAAVKSTNLEWKWEDMRPKSKRRTAVPRPGWRHKSFVPNGSRWLFQYGIDKGTAKLRILDMVGDAFVQFVGYGSRILMDEYSFGTGLAPPRIVGESLAPNQVVFAAQFAGLSLISIYLATFSQNPDGKIQGTITMNRKVEEEYPISFFMLYEGLLGIVTAKQATIEQWINPLTRRRVEPSAHWIPRGIQVAKNRLLLLEADSSDEPEQYQIEIYDITSVRGSQQEFIDADGNPISLQHTSSFKILDPPTEPFFAPYWEDRFGEPGVHIGFKMLFLSGGTIWHVNFHLDSEIASDGSLQDQLSLEQPAILGSTAEEWPAGRSSTSYALGPRASRIVWVGRKAEVRIRSDWSDDLITTGETVVSCSRILDMKALPQNTQSIHAFDEATGILLLEDTPTHQALFWFV